MKAALERLFAGDIPYVLAGLEQLPSSPILLAGSFNPLHKGHVQLLTAAEKVTGRTGLLELSLTNVDKPSPGLDEIKRRLQELEKQFGVVITCAPTFAEKAEVLPGAWFVMGYDTAIRLLDPAYHDDIPAMLTRFAELEIRFAVAGRLYEGAYQSLDQLAIPDGFKDLFVAIPEALFRADISSSGLRKKGT
jgi:hypothetical protein